MSPLLLEPGLPFALSVAARATLLLLLAVSIHAVANRRASAATRHLVWMLTLVGLLLLPILSSALPGWGIPVWQTPREPAPVLVPATSRVEPPTSPAREGPVPSAATPMQPAGGAPFGAPWTGAVLSLYAAGVLLLLARAGAERVTIRRIARSAEPVTEAEWTELVRSSARSLGVTRPVRLLRSRGAMMPMTWGTLHPAILLPAVADAWPERRRRAVLLHEMAHVARCDCLTQRLAAVACALYWFHPGVWWAARRLRTERELACDDRVLALGTRPREYAGHLLEIAHKLHAPPTSAVAVSMARPSQLEGRMLAVLDVNRRRAAPGRRARLVAGLGTAVLLLPLASVRAVVGRAPERPTPAAIPSPGSHLPHAGTATIDTDNPWRGDPMGVARRVGAALPEPVQTTPVEERSIGPRPSSASPSGAAPRPHPQTPRAGEGVPASDRDHAEVFTRDGTLRLALEADQITLRFTDRGLRRIEQDLHAQGGGTDDPALRLDPFSHRVAVRSVQAMNMAFPLTSIRSVEHENGALVLLTHASAGGERSRNGARRGEVRLDRVVPEQAERFVATFWKVKGAHLPPPTAGAALP